MSRCYIIVEVFVAIAFAGCHMNHTADTIVAINFPLEYYNYYCTGIAVSLYTCSYIFIPHAGDVYHQASTITASMHRIEAQTRTAEQNMVDAYKIANATTTHNIHKARHHIPLVDAYVLNITELMWKSQTYPGVRGDIPMARIHFSVSCIGK